jgi:hypothetical protein
MNLDIVAKCSVHSAPDPFILKKAKEESIDSAAQEIEIRLTPLNFNNF